MLESSFRTAYLKTGAIKGILRRRGNLTSITYTVLFSGNSLHSNFSYEKLREPAEQIIFDVA